MVVQGMKSFFNDGTELQVGLQVKVKDKTGIITNIHTNITVVPVYEVMLEDNWSALVLPNAISQIL